MVILINNIDYIIVINLTSNVSITGAYISANQATIDRLETIVNKSLLDDVKSTPTPDIITTAKINNVAIPISKSNNTFVSLGGINTQSNLSINTGLSVVNKQEIIIPQANINQNLVNNLSINVGTPTLPENFDTVGVFPAPLIIDSDIKTYDDALNYFNSNGIFITGTTSSKLQTLVGSFINIKSKNDLIKKVGIYDTSSVNLNSALQGVNQSQLTIQTPIVSIQSLKMLIEDSNIDMSHKRILIPGTGIIGMILTQGTIFEYILYLDTPYPIKYIDFPDGTTMFMYKRSEDDLDQSGNMILYPGLIDEPKIISEVFIDRGANNAFEPVKRLKNVKSLNELTKIGLGYYKINTKGFNFKNI